MEILPYQKEIFETFKREFKYRLKDENAFMEIIVDCCRLISEMKNNNEVDLNQRFVDYLKNISTTMDILEMYMPKNLKKIDKTFVFSALIQ